MKKAALTSTPVDGAEEVTQVVMEAEKGSGTMPSPVASAKKTQKRKPTPRQIKAAQLMAENGRKDKPSSTGEILRQAGYSPAVVEKPSKVTASPVFQELLDQYIPDNTLAQTHARLLSTRKIEHMTFPLGPEGEDDESLSGANPNLPNDMEEYVERTTLTDQEIKDMLAEVNCAVKRIVHGNTARHVYFWAHDANAQSKALELAYKMKGHLTKDGGAGGGNVFNFNSGTQQFVNKPGVSQS